MLARAASAALTSALATAVSSAASAAGASVATALVASAQTNTRVAGGYKREIKEQERCADSRRLRAEFPDRIPVIVEPSDARQPPIDKRKFLVPADLTVGQLMYVVRKRVRLPAEQALFFAVADARAIPPAAALVSDIFERHGDPDGHLYIAYCTENAFGDDSE